MKNVNEILEIAKLSKIDMTPEEAEILLAGMGDMLKTVQSIKDLDLSNYDCTGEIQVAKLRDDIVQNSLPVDMILSGAAGRKDNFFTV